MENFEIVKELARALESAKGNCWKVRVGKTNYYIQLKEYEEEQTTYNGWSYTNTVRYYALIDNAKKVIVETSADNYIIDVAYKMLDYIK